MIMVEVRNRNNSRMRDYIHKVKEMLCDIEDCFDEEASASRYNESDNEYYEHTPRRRGLYRY